MLEYPKTYEEARIVLKDSAHDDYMQYCQKKTLLRGGLITGISMGVAALFGVVSKSSTAFLAALPLASMISFSGFVPYIVNRNTMRRKESEKLIKGKSEEEVMKIASMYVDEYNDFEERQSRGR